MILLKRLKPPSRKKMPSSNETERDYFTLNDDAVVAEGAENSESSKAAESTDNDVVTDAGLEDTEEAATDISESIADITANVDDLLSDIPKINLTSSTTDEE
jgi:hypothetical protein